MRQNNKIPDGGKQTDTHGISGLPKPWDTAVQLIGTFGLAVFLVLYYLFIMKPAEEKRYEILSDKFYNLSNSLNNLTDSVNHFTQVLDEKETLINKEQTIKMKKLYIAAVKNRLGSIICDRLNKNISQEDLRKEINIEMLKLSIYIDEGFYQKEILKKQPPIFTQILNDIQKRIWDNQGCSRIIAEDAINDKWKNLTIQDVESKLNTALEQSFELMPKPN